MTSVPKPANPAKGVRSQRRGQRSLAPVFTASGKAVWREKGALDPFQLLVVFGWGQGFTSVGLSFLTCRVEGLEDVAVGSAHLPFLNFTLTYTCWLLLLSLLVPSEPPHAIGVPSLWVTDLLGGAERTRSYFKKLGQCATIYVY